MKMISVMDEKHFLKQIEAIFEKKRKDVEQEFSPEFYKYFKRFFENPQTFKAYSKMCKHVFDITKARRKKVLDVGCGYGLVSIHLGIYGSEVIGVDLNEGRIKVFGKILRSLSPSLNNVTARLEDALELDYNNEHFDVVVCNEVISHVKDLDLLLQRMNKALKSSGLLYISDGNNKLNVLMRHKRRQRWENAEFRYRSERKKMIRKMFPALDAKTLDLLAEETAGMYGGEIFRAVNQYLKEGRIIDKPTFKFREPTTGYYPEREFNPFALKKNITKFGFKAKILRPYFVAEHPSPAKRVIKKLLAQTVRLLHPISILASTKFEILAEKL